MGDSLSAGTDINGDGVPDAVIGAPKEPSSELTTEPITWAGGSVAVFSGVTGQRLWQEYGSHLPGGEGPRVGLGNCLASLDDLDGDGYAEWGLLYRDPDYDVLGDGLGRVRIFRGGPGDAFQACTAQLNSLGVGAELTIPRAISPSSDCMRIRATGAPAGESGLFFYGSAAPEVPFGDGLLCIGPSFWRAGPPVTIRDEQIAFQDLDLQGPPLNAGGGALLAGSTWRFQFWYRDPAGPSGVNLSDARDVTFTP